MKNKYYLYILVCVIILITACGGESSKENTSGATMNNQQENEQESSEGKPNENASVLNMPKINDMSRLAFTYIPFKVDGKGSEVIPIYDNIDDKESTHEVKQNIDVWLNATENRSRYQVIVSEDLWGFVDREYVKLYPRGSVNTKMGKLNLREEKSTKAKIIIGLDKHQMVFVTDISDKNWYKINTFDGKIGYVSSKYIKFTDGRENLFQGISQEEFISNYNELKRDEYRLVMKEYRLQAVDKHIARSDFNNGGNVDKAFLSLKKNSETIHLVVWCAESNTYIIVDSFDMPSFVGVEVFPQNETLSSAYENEQVKMLSDGINLVSFEKGYNYIYYWDGKSYKKFIYNE